MTGYEAELSAAYDAPGRWGAHPVRAVVIRVFAFAFPLVASIAFVHYASAVVAVPTQSFFLFASWWILMSGTATVVLVVFDRLTRQLLPLAALYKVSLVFPDRAPSRFRVAMRRNTVASLEERLAHAAGGHDLTPVAAAEQLLSLVAELNAHDTLTRGHSERVRAYAHMIGEEMRLGKQDLDLLNWAALLHDVGKLMVPQEILAKPGRPTDEEWDILRQHPLLGEQLVEPLREWLGTWADAVGDHHERWDGVGYPRGRGGDDISLAGRIVAVADVYDVITSARSYKPALTSARGRDEIARHAGVQFDPRVVRAFLSIGLGRLRLTMGPLSWLAHAPILGRLPLTPALGSAGAAMLTVAAATAGGIVAGPAAPVAAATAPAVVAHRAQLDAPNLERAVNEDEAVVVSITGVTGRPGIDVLRITGQPAAGRASVLPDDTLRYVPAPNFSGTVRIGYEACAGPGNCARGTIRIVVRPVNDAPGLADDAARVRQGASTSIDVLANDTDPDGDPLTLERVAAVSSGTVRIVRGRARFTPDARSIGTASFSYTARDGHGGSGRARVRVTVTPRAVGPTAGPKVVPDSVPGAAPADNRPPRAVDDVASLPEGSSVLLAVLANDDDPDGDALSLSAVGTPAFGVAALRGDRIQFTAPADRNGSVVVPYTVADAGGGSDEGQATFVVSAVNQPPSFTLASDEAALEDAGARARAGWVTAIRPGPPAESGQSVTFSVTTDRPELFASGGQPAVGTDGTLTYEGARNASGSTVVTVRAVDNGGTGAGGSDTSQAQQRTLTIAPVNDAPAFTAGAAESVGESSGAHFRPGWATAIDAGAPDETSQSISFVVDVDRPGLFSAQPAVAPDGTLTYTVAPSANGTATLTVRAHDDGGVADGGVDASDPQTVSITVAAVNEAPAFTAGADDTVAEDSGARAVPGWATGISAGPADEAGQVVSFTLHADQPALFAVQPAVAASGALTYTPAANAHGSTTVTVVAADDGGTADGGADTSSPRTLTITITPVNDAPSAADDGVSLNEDAPGGATFDVLANDSDIDGDSVSLASFDASGIVDGALTQGSGGTFTYTPDAGWSGVESFTYDVGDGAGGSATGTVTVTVVPQPDPPHAGDDAYLVTENTTLVVAAPGLLDNDGDDDGDPLTAETAAVTGPAHGTLGLAADGSFTYAPDPGYSGSDTFTYRIGDGTGATADGTVDLTVSSVASISTLFFQPTTAGSRVFDLDPATPPSASTFADLAGDGSPGITIAKSNGSEGTSDLSKQVTWSYTLPTTFTIAGPVTLQLWSAANGLLNLSSGTLYAYLYDCAAGGTGCTRIAASTLSRTPWNATLLGWTYNTLTIGSVSRTMAPGRELRVRLLFSNTNLWVTTTAAYPSSLVVTLG